jgi:hypothetical protein
MQHESEIREPLILGKKSYHQITEDIVKPIEGKSTKLWYILLTVSAICFLWGIGCLSYTIGTGIGVWGSNNGVDWAWDITNFVWWIGIGHAGTLISAVLLLFRQKWRMAINRSAEAMTIFAVMCAAISYCYIPAALGLTTGCSHCQINSVRYGLTLTHL